jgi:hypothetical protein
MDVHRKQLGLHRHEERRIVDIRRRIERPAAILLPREIEMAQFGIE